MPTALRRAVIWLGLSISLTLAATAMADEPSRRALVIGIDSYENIPPLQKARNDATAISAALKRAGFAVSTHLDVTRQELNLELSRFSEELAPGDEAVFYFAGHGIEIDGRNHLLPADVPRVAPGQQAFLIGESLAVDRVLDLIRERGARVSMLILDACRENPFPRQGTRSVGATRGLARLDPPEGAFILFSAGFGQAALDRLSEDDPDPNSVFTRQLLPLLETPGLPVHEIARQVRIGVMELAQSIGHDQRPAYYDEITGEFTILAGLAHPAEPDLCDTARAAWNAIEQLGNRPAIEAFLAMHGSCADVASQARAELDRLPEVAQIAADAIAWGLVRHTSDPDLLERFVETHPDSPHAEEALTRAAALRAMSEAAPAPEADPDELALAAWELVRGTSDPDLLERFADMHRGSMHAAEALTRAAALRAIPQPQPAPEADPEEVALAFWGLVRDTSDPDLLERFAAAHPDSHFVPEARARAEARRVALIAPPAALPSETPEALATEEDAAFRAFLHAPPAAPQIGALFRDCDICPEMRQILGTEVLFGAPETYVTVQPDERPPLRLALAEPFAVAVTETTQAEFAAFEAATGYLRDQTCLQHFPHDRLPLLSTRDVIERAQPDLPVICVSWDDAQAYVAWLSEQTGHHYRLPSEIEFEYLVEAFHFNTPLSEIIADRDICAWVNIADRSSGFSWRDFSCEQRLGPGVLPVRALEADAFGLHHLLGNVWEWMQDCYAETPEDTILKRRAEIDCNRRSMRGGAWTDPLATLRSSNRNWDLQSYRADNLGFRVVRELAPQEFAAP